MEMNVSCEWVAIFPPDRPACSVWCSRDRTGGLDLLWNDAGFNEHGELVRFGTMRGDVARDGPFPVTIQVTVPASGRFSIPMCVDVIADDGNAVADKAHNGGVTIRTRVTDCY